METIELWAQTLSGFQSHRQTDSITWNKSRFKIRNYQRNRYRGSSSPRVQNAYHTFHRYQLCGDPRFRPIWLRKKEGSHHAQIGRSCFEPLRTQQWFIENEIYSRHRRIVNNRRRCVSPYQPHSNSGISVAGEVPVRTYTYLEMERREMNAKLITIIKLGPTMMIARLSPIHPFGIGM